MLIPRIFDRTKTKRPTRHHRLSTALSLELLSLESRIPLSTGLVQTIELPDVARTLDVGFIGPIDGKAPPGLRMECIAEERPMVGVPNDHPLAGEPFLHLHRLKEESFVFTSRKNAPNYRASLAESMARALTSAPQPRGEGDR